MHRKRLTVVLVVFAAAAVGLSLMIGTAAGQGNGKSVAQVVAKPTIVTVTLGKPTEFAFKLSKKDMITAGKVTFKVTNLGAIDHNFKLCKAVFTAKALANACTGAVGGATKNLKKGQTQSITLTLKKGTFEFLCTLSGHAAGGMKGLMGIGVKLSSAQTNIVSTATPKPETPAEQAGACAAPVSTTLNVTMDDYFFVGMPASIKCGNVTVVAPNVGLDEHNVAFNGKAPGEVVHAGLTATQTLFMGVGTYAYVCSVGDHAGQGMAGSLSVT
jgi:plastocyanin